MSKVLNTAFGGECRVKLVLLKTVYKPDVFTLYDVKKHSYNDRN